MKTNYHALLTEIDKRATDLDWRDASGGFTAQLGTRRLHVNPTAILVGSIMMAVFKMTDAEKVLLDSVLHTAESFAVAALIAELQADAVRSAAFNPLSEDGPKNRNPRQG